MNAPKHVVVAGGGCAGLAAAALLAERGARVTLLEARAHLGGRTYSFIDRKTGDVLDNGQHLFMGCYHETKKFLARVGSSDTISYERQLRVPYLDTETGRHDLRCPRIPAPMHLIKGLTSFKAVSWGDRLAASKIKGAIKRMRAHNTPDISAEEWLIQSGQTETLRRVLWDPVIIAALNVFPRDASARLSAEVLRRMFFGTHADSMFGLATVGLSDVLAEPARRYMEKQGGEVRVKEPVVEFVMEGNRCIGVVTKSGERMEADAVISAMPHRELARLLPTFEQSADALGHAPIISLYVWYDRPVMKEKYACLLGTTIQWAFNRNAFAPDAQNHDRQCISLVISADTEVAAQPNADVAARALDEMKRLFPKAAEARVLDWRVITDHFATFRPTPGIDRLRPEPDAGPRGLFLAGDWTATGLPSTIEGAVQSGHRAAEMALQR